VRRYDKAVFEDRHYHFFSLIPLSFWLRLSDTNAASAWPSRREALFSAAKILARFLCSLYAQDSPRPFLSQEEPFRVVFLLRPFNAAGRRRPREFEPGPPNIPFFERGSPDVFPRKASDRFWQPLAIPKTDLVPLACLCKISPSHNPRASSSPVGEMLG